MAVPTARHGRGWASRAGSASWRAWSRRSGPCRRPNNPSTSADRSSSPLGKHPLPDSDSSDRKKNETKETGMAVEEEDS